MAGRHRAQTFRVGTTRRRVVMGGGVVLASLFATGVPALLPGPQLPAQLWSAAPTMRLAVPDPAVPQAAPEAAAAEPTRRTPVATRSRAAPSATTHPATSRPAPRPRTAAPQRAAAPPLEAAAPPRPVPRPAPPAVSPPAAVATAPRQPAPPPAPPAATGRGARIVAMARSLLGRGIPYVWGGKTLAGFDCSGFVYWVLSHVGATDTYRSSAALKAWAVPIPRAAAQPGDLAFWPGHVAIYAGADRVIDAGNEATDLSERAIYGSPTFGRVP